ncbi:MAG: nickel pincer cofactor biosynthesis protein LarC [Lachnospiraceae bacterium]|nr:nickel pincer cofactor biosynthesis protein LarC [Lachnospiraceae bacterium]
MNERILYLECSSGISGDMTVAALLDLGADRNVLTEALSSLPLSGYSIEIKDVYKSGIRACDFHVVLDAEHENHDHDMTYLHGTGYQSDSHAHNPQNSHFNESHSKGHAHDPQNSHFNEFHSDSHAHDPQNSHFSEFHSDSHAHDPQSSHTSERCNEIHIQDSKSPHESEHRNAAHCHTDAASSHSEALCACAKNEHQYTQEMSAFTGDCSDAPAHTEVSQCAPAYAEVSPVVPAHTEVSQCAPAYAEDSHGVPTPADQFHGHSHAHTARNLQDIIAIIRAGHLTANAADLAIRIFEILARAEASVHGKGINEVHFHEVGAVDSIVDIVAAAVCLDNLHPDQVIVSALAEGCGQIRCQHGLIPVPVPAVTAISEQEGLVLRLTGIQGELVTPTGAAIAAAIRSGETLPDQIQICRVGYGAGKRDYATAGILRAMMVKSVKAKDPLNACEALCGASTHADSYACAGAEADSAPVSAHGDTILALEANIDDCTGEALAFTMQQLMESGALDVFYTPVYMKKNRPAYLLKVLCSQEIRTALESIIFQNTTTIGIRRQVMERTKLNRRVVSVRTPWGAADVKCCDYNGLTRFYPENDSVSRLSRENGIGFSELYSLLQEYARGLIESSE